LLFGSKVNDWQQTNAGVCAPCGSESCVLGDALADDGGRDLIHLHSAVRLGNVNRCEAELAGFLQQVTSDGEVFVFDFFDIGDDFVLREVFCCLRNQLMLLIEIFGREDLSGLALFEQKTCACDLCFGYYCRSHNSPFRSLTTEDTQATSASPCHHKSFDASFR
jgi:hypothetical protein